MSTSVFSTGAYDPDPSINFYGKLWECMGAIIERGKQGKQQLELLQMRVKKNQMSMEAFSENIKSRKFLPLLEEGSLGRSWVELKDQILSIEDACKQVADKYKDMLEKTTNELKQYQDLMLKIEEEYNAINRKKKTAVDDVQKKRERYNVAFTDWDKAEAEYQQQPNKFGNKEKEMKQKVDRKAQARQQAEGVYQESVRLCNAVEAEYEMKMGEFLRRFERIEYIRMTYSRDKLTELYQIWGDQFGSDTGGAGSGIGLPMDVQQVAIPGFERKQPASGGSSGIGQPKNQNLGGPPLVKKRAAFEFTASNEGEVTVIEGEIVEVLIENTGQEDTGWTHVRKVNGQEGYVPTTYLEDMPAQVPMQLAAQPQQQKPVVQVQSAVVPNIVNAPAKTAQVPKAKVIYDYQSSTDTDVSVSEGEIVDISPDDLNDQDWAFVTKSNGEQGYVPRTYIEFLD
ncbi:MAG: hypothetical protein EZS28_012224 [Streblomastix strix]|uniref:SH3 domain-containing protein n=1 Tax=Streblomastix strix TaxID=222440 RepID=A0A5J4WD24_9EUKA|nr:MAG: hypothetical protein EZS28_012224 [Streblomastix strix]